MKAAQKPLGAPLFEGEVPGQGVVGEGVNINFNFRYFRRCGIIPVQSFRSHICPQASGLGLTKVDDLPVIQYKYVPQPLPIIILTGSALSQITGKYWYN
jgi:hypothetical protein